MKHEMSRDELQPDPLLGAALRWAEGEVPLDEVDWTAMRSTIRGKAVLPLARRKLATRRGMPRWMRPLIPIAAAASVAVVVWTGGLGRQGPSAAVLQQATPAATAQLSIQEALSADLSEQEFRTIVAGHTDPDELLIIAASEP